MLCPHCGHTFELTWPRYWAAPTGKHICPQCNGIFKLVITLRYFLTIALTIVIAGFIPTEIARRAGAPIGICMAVYAICALGVTIPLDRAIDNSKRKSKALKDNKSSTKSA